MKFLRKLSKIFDAAAFLLLLCVMIFFVDSYQKLPDQIAFGLSQYHLIWGSKLYFVGLLWMTMISFGLLLILERFPALTPYPVRITPENFEKQRTLSAFFLSAGNCIIMAMYLMIILLMYYRANHVTADIQLYLYLVFALFLLLVAHIIAYFAVARHIERRGND